MSGQGMAPARWRLLIVGVGGQGVLTAARVLGDAAVLAGQEVAVGQLHGMSQRGGSVQASVLVGPGRSSFIPNRGAHAVLGLEPMEVLRVRPSMGPATQVVLHMGRIVPSSLTRGGVPYPDPDETLATLRREVGDVFEIAAPALGPGGTPLPLNVLALGVLSGLELVPFDPEFVQRAIVARCPVHLEEANRLAFERGRALVPSPRQNQLRG